MNTKTEQSVTTFNTYLRSFVNFQMISLLPKVLWVSFLSYLC